MTTKELINRLKEIDPEGNKKVEFSYRTPGYYPDDSDIHYVMVRDVDLDNRDNKIVIS